MRKLILKLLRDIKGSKGQFIAITLVIAVGAFFYTGLTTLSGSLNTYTNDYYKNHNLSDLNVYYSQISDDQISSLQSIEGINKIEGRYTFDATQSFDNLKTDLKIHSIPKNNEINTPTIVEGKMPSSKDEILLDSLYAKEHNYHVGDKIKVNTNNKELKFTISGFCENVEHVFNIKDPSLVIPDHKTFGIAYMSDEKIPEVSGNFYYNELIIDAKAGSDIEKIGDTIELKSKDFNYLYQLSKERMVSFSTLDTSIKSNKVMSKVLPLVFFIVAAIIIFLTMSRIIDSQRNQIGIMKALGIKNSSIMLHYIGYSIFVGLLGSIIGSILGFITFIHIGNAQLAQSYSLPNFTLTMNYVNMIPTIVFAVAFGVIASYLSCRKILKECAAQAMRPKPPKKSKEIFIERFKGTWNRLSYGNKIILRNIFLTKQRALFTSVGVIICSTLLIISFGYKTSTEYVGQSLLNDVYKYDLRVDYKLPITSATLNLPSGLESQYTLAELPVEFINSNDKKDAALVVTEKDNNLINIYDDQKSIISLDDDGVIIPKSYADKYKISEGDLIKLKFLSPDLKGQSIDMKVSKISLQYSGQAFYCTPEYLKSFGINYNPTTLLVKVDNSNELSSARSFFNDDKLVNKVTDKESLKKSINLSLQQSYSVIVLFILCAIILSSAAIFTISSINIFERTRELATLKVLGYQKNRINKLIFIENLIITIFSIIISLPIGTYLYKTFTKSLSTVNQIIPEKLGVSTIILSISLTLLVTVIANLLLRRKVKKINMIESLKSVE